MSFDFEAAVSFARGTLYAALRQDCGSDWDAYVDHRFVRGLATGELPQTEFIAWMVQDYLYLVHYARAYALLIAKSDTLEQMQSAARIVSGLLNDEMTLHRRELLEAGVTEAALAQAPEAIETLAYSRYILDRALAGDMLDLMVTLAACLAGYGEIGQRLLADPRTVLEGNPYRDWIETYGGEGYQNLVREGVLALDAVGQTRGGAARFPLLSDQFRQAVRLETAFWDAGRSIQPPSR